MRGRPQNNPTPDFFLKRTSVDPVKGCWLWSKTKTPSGYGLTTVNYTTRLAHRLAFEVFNGPIPTGLCVCHVCDNPPCVNPLHLFLGTPKDNTQDSILKGRFKGWDNKGQKHYAVKVSLADVAEIRKSSLPQSELAARFGIDQSQISRIKNYKAHKQ